MSKTIEAPSLVEPELAEHRGGTSWLPQIFQAAGAGGLAILGQGLFAGAQFLMNVLLARWLSTDQYGAFALAYSGFLLFLMLYGACVYEPLIVFGSGRHASRFQEYFGLLARSNILVLAGFSALMLVSSSLFGRLFSPEVGRDFVALSFASPFVLVMWLGRGGFYARMSPGDAAWGGFIYFCALTAAIVGLRQSGRLSGSTAFLSMGLAGFVANVYLLWRIGFTWKRAAGSLTLKEVWGDHWSYGRWALASAVASWFPQNIYYALLPAKSGLEGAAAMRALTNLINPLLQTLAALAAVLIPVFVRRLQEGGIPKMKNTMRTLTLLLIPGSVFYLVALWFSRSLVFRLVYAGKYQQYETWPLLLTGLVPIAVAAAIIVGSALRALEKPEWIFWAYAAATVSVIVLGLPLTLRGGVLGATGSLLISSLVAAITMAWFFHRIDSTENNRVIEVQSDYTGGFRNNSK